MASYTTPPMHGSLTGDQFNLELYSTKCCTFPFKMKYMYVHYWYPNLWPLMYMYKQGYTQTRELQSVRKYLPVKDLGVIKLRTVSGIRSCHSIKLNFSFDCLKSHVFRFMHLHVTLLLIDHLKPFKISTFRKCPLVLYTHGDTIWTVLVASCTTIQIHSNGFRGSIDSPNKLPPCPLAPPPPYSYATD